MKAGQVWGKKEIIHAKGVLEFHRIEPKQDGGCGRPKTKNKRNGA
mgnify:CR=1 FL=1